MEILFREPSTPDEATLKNEGHALQCNTAGPYNDIPNLLRDGSICGHGLDVFVIHNFSLAAWHTRQWPGEIRTAR